MVEKFFCVFEPGTWATRQAVHLNVSLAQGSEQPTELCFVASKVKQLQNNQENQFQEIGYVSNPILFEEFQLDRQFNVTAAAVRAPLRAPLDNIVRAPVRNSREWCLSVKFKWFQVEC